MAGLQIHNYRVKSEAKRIKDPQKLHSSIQRKRIEKKGRNTLQ